MSYSQLAIHDHLDLDPPSDVALDEDLLISTPDQSSVYTTTSGATKQGSFYSTAQDPTYNPHCDQKSSPSQTTHNNNNNNNSPGGNLSSQGVIIASPIDEKRNSYPFSIVWGSLPLITWLIPCIGHLGIADSRGEIHDFHGPYDVKRGRFMTGQVLKYYQLPPDVLSKYNINTAQQWDKSIYQSDLYYSGTVHNIVSNNCHHHVATALTNAGYSVNSKDNNTSMMEVWWVIMTKGNWVSAERLFCRVLLPTIITWGFIIGFFVLVGKFWGKQ
jgi:hypothetical protein